MSQTGNYGPRPDLLGNAHLSRDELIATFKFQPIKWSQAIQEKGADLHLVRTPEPATKSYCGTGHITKDGIILIFDSKFIAEKFWRDEMKEDGYLRDALRDEYGVTSSGIIVPFLDLLPPLPDFTMTFKPYYISSAVDSKIEDDETADEDYLSVEGKEFRALLRKACKMDSKDGDFKRFKSCVTKMDVDPVIRDVLLERQKKGAI